MVLTLAPPSPVRTEGTALCQTERCTTVSVRTDLQVNVDTALYIYHCDLVLFVLDNKSILVYGMSTETLLK